MFPDGNRTRIVSFTQDALAQLSYRFDNRSAAARPEIDDGQRASWEFISCLMTRGSNPLVPPRQDFYQITQTQRPV